MEIRENLKDGQEIILRSLKLDDIEDLMDFYGAVPYEDRRYFKIDVSRKQTVKDRLNSTLNVGADRVIAIHGGKIVAEGELIFSHGDWYRDRGEIRVMVDEGFRQKGVGMLIMRELYYLAQQHKLDKIVAKIMGPQIPSKNLLEKFAFKENHVLPNYVVDQDGNTQDMLIMICDMEDYWRELESVYCNTDWGRCR